MIENVLNGMYYICAMVCMVMVGEWTYHWTTRDIRKWVLAAGIYMVGFVSCVIMFSDILFSSAFFLLAEICSWALVCEESFGTKLGKIFIITLAISVVEIWVSILIDAVCGETIDLEWSRLFRAVCTFLLFYIFSRNWWYYRAIGYIDNLSKWKKCLILIVMGLGITLAAYGNAINIFLNNQQVTVLFKVLITLNVTMVMGIIVWFIIENNQKNYYMEQNQLKEEYIHIQQEYYRMLYEKDREMRCFRHDVASQMGMLQMLLERGDVSGATEQLKQVYQDFSKASLQKKHVGDEVLDSILSMMNQKAVENGVELKIKGEITGKNELDVYELCTILSNAISNAIEACQNMQEGKTVCVKLMEHNNSLCFVIENAATEDMYLAALKGETTKGDKMQHGYGVQNIRRAVERLNGSMEYRYADGKLELEINT